MGLVVDEVTELGPITLLKVRRDGAQPTRAYLRPPQETPFSVVKSIVGSIRTCLENLGVWGKAPAAAGHQTRQIVEQSGGNHDQTGTKLRSKRGTQEAVSTAAFGLPKAQIGMAVCKQLPNIHDVKLVKCHDVNSAINI